MMKKFSTQTEKELEWLKNEIQKDEVDLNKDKQNLIESIRGIKKEEIINNNNKSLTLWERIKKVLMGF